MAQATIITESTSSGPRSLPPVDAQITLVEPSSTSFRATTLTNHTLSRTSSKCTLLSVPDSAAQVDIVNGLPHAYVKLDARSYKSQTFARQLLSTFAALRVPGWNRTCFDPATLSLRRVPGALTNEVFFVSCPSSPSVPTLLLRIYGPSSDSLISRSRELHTLHILSSRYHLGPRIYGTFTNGRIEEYFDSITLVPSELRDTTISRWIGIRMAELHSVRISAVEGPLAVSSQEGKSWEIGVKKNVKTWLPVAYQVLAHPNMSAQDRATLDAFSQQWSRYMRWISHVEKAEGPSRRVFAHNDTQYGNLLRLTGTLPEGTPDHRQPEIVVVDFEYAAPNPLAFDIANHFHEWTADYQSSTPHMLDPSRYPTAEERRNFYRAYLSHADSSDSRIPKAASEACLAQLERQVRVWSPASHGMWAVWGIVQAKDNVEKDMNEGEFDYIGYAKCRMAAFLRELKELGVH